MNKHQWIGQSGRLYDYYFYPIQGNTAFRDEPGNYIYAMLVGGTWKAIYVGQTSSLSQRLATHEKEAAARRMGATHIHAHVSSADDKIRRNEESDLINEHQPFLNVFP